MENLLGNTAKELLDIKTQIKELKGQELIKANSLSTTYLSECYTIIKDINIEKEKFKTIRNFKTNLMNKISDTDKILNTVLLTLNKALKNSNENTINLLKLSDFSIVTKYSKLSNNNQKAINSKENLNKKSFEDLIIELIKKQNKEESIKRAKKLVSNNGYKVV